MRYPTINVDLITGRTSVPNALEIPKNLVGLDDEQLRLVDGEIIDAATIGKWMIDASGYKRVPSAHPLADWPIRECAWNDKLLETEDGWRTMSVEEVAEDELNNRARPIKAECRRRIYAVASAEAQMNVATVGMLIASKSVGDRTAEENQMLQGAKDGATWVAAMKAAVAELAADKEADFQLDAAWPDCPAAAAEVYSQF